ncbi:ATP-binding cassette domain-containing protein [Micromonospora purpureochromogenes]|uniref:ATP-binding cassette domain-containing protein n=1 Tax=Micromonospora purpureochromogenes TaxID=47872 RepID=UPI003324C2EF
MLLEDVWLRYHRRGPWVLRAAQARIEPGEVAVVLGRNGVGKSSLLQLAAGVLRPGRGRVVDRPRHIGWVPERFPPPTSPSPSRPTSPRWAGSPGCPGPGRRGRPTGGPSGWAWPGSGA